MTQRESRSDSRSIRGLQQAVRHIEASPPNLQPVHRQTSLARCTLAQQPGASRPKTVHAPRSEGPSARSPDLVPLFAPESSQRAARHPASRHIPRAPDVVAAKIQTKHQHSHRRRHKMYSLLLLVRHLKPLSRHCGLRSARLSRAPPIPGQSVWNPHAAVGGRHAPRRLPP